jgi:succinyl-diaminopimelate desuccinylase
VRQKPAFGEVSPPNESRKIKEYTMSTESFAKYIESYRQEMIGAVLDLVSIRSVQEDPAPKAPFGPGPAKALMKTLEMASGLGFRVSNLNGYIGYAEYGHGEDYVAVLGHVDVVPEGEGWIYPPFDPVTKEGKIYGRGTTDDKGPLVAALFALKAIKDANVKLSKRVRLIIGTNEETENEDIKYYLANEEPPCCGFTPDAFFPLVYAEKGFINLKIEKTVATEISPIQELEGGLVANMVPQSAKAAIVADDPYDIVRSCSQFSKKTGILISTYVLGNKAIIRSTGEAAHASVPEQGKNAIMQLISFLAGLDGLPGKWSETFSFLADRIGLETNGLSLGLALRDEISGGLTLNVGKIKLSHGILSLVIDIRYPVTAHLHDVMLPLEKVLKDAEFTFAITEHQNPLYFPKDSSLVRTLHRIFKEQTGIDAKPLAIGGGTYAKEMSNIVAFGPVFPGKPLVEHKPNEYFAIDDLIMCSKIYAQAIYELCR